MQSIIDEMIPVDLEQFFLSMRTTLSDIKNVCFHINTVSRFCASSFGEVCFESFSGQGGKNGFSVLRFFPPSFHGGRRSVCSCSPLWELPRSAAVCINRRVCVGEAVHSSSSRFLNFYDVAPVSSVDASARWLPQRGNPRQTLPSQTPFVI